jgi:hypothetical protein
LRCKQAKHHIDRMVGTWQLPNPVQMAVQDARLKMLDDLHTGPPLVIDLLSQATRIHSPPDLIMLVIILCGRLMKPALDQVGNDLRAATVELHTR